MDELKCKEILFSKVLSATDYFRLEAEYFNSVSVSYHRLLKGKDIAEDIQYGTSKYCDEIEGDYPVLRLNELHNGFIEYPQKYCHSLSSQEFEKLRLRKGDVLVIRTNGNPNLVGRSAVVLEDTKFAYASYLYKVTPNGIINSETLVTYLNCRYGRYEIDKNSIKGNQTNFSPAKFRDINIPVFSEKVQNIVKKLLNQAYQDKLMADSIYKSAEQRLLLDFNFVECISKGCSVSVKSFSESIGKCSRLDAEYYQPKYDALFKSLKRFETRTLGGSDGIVSVKKSIEPGSSVYQNKGIPFIRVSDISKFEIAEPEIYLPEDVVEDIHSLYPQKDTILFSKDGSVGIAFKIEEDVEIITSGALLHLTVRDVSMVLPDYLTIVLNSPIVQLQAERDSNGAVIQHWKPSEINNVIIPVLDMEIQEEIASNVQESFAFRKRSKELLGYAKQVIELVIEQDEQSAVKWFEDKKADLRGEA